MANLAIIVSNDRPIREDRHPRTWLLFRDKDTIEIHVTHDSHNRPFCARQKCRVNSTGECCGAWSLKSELIQQGRVTQWKQSDC